MSRIHTELPDPLPPPFSIIHHFRYVFKATSCISTELLYVCPCWSSCLCSSMLGVPQEYMTYEFVPTSPVESHMSGSSNLDSFLYGRKVPLEPLLYWVLPPGLVQYCSKHSCIVAVKLFFFILLVSVHILHP